MKSLAQTIRVMLYSIRIASHRIASHRIERSYVAWCPRLLAFCGEAPTEHLAVERSVAALFVQGYVCVTC